jgi:transposase-like protein
MDPTTVCCPTLACPARGHTGQGTIGIHSRQDTRCLGTACHQTCSATHGTAVSRLHTATETVTLVVTVLAHGCPPHALVAACGFDERTGARWMARGGVHGQAVQEPRVEHPRDLGPVQAEERRVTKRGGIVWRALAMMVATRVWLAGEVREQRDLPWIRRLSERVRTGALPRPLVWCPEGFVAAGRAMREPWRAPEHTGASGRPRRRPWRNVCLAQVVQRSAQRHGVDGERRIVEGTPARVETLRRRAQGDGVSNTASSERLNATFRERVAARTRRGRALARHTLPWRHGRSLRGTIDHCCPPHERLRDASPAVGGAGAARPPAMAAGITTHCWTVQERVSLPVPPSRWTPPKQCGRPSRALKRLVERWARDHG